MQKGEPVPSLLGHVVAIMRKFSCAICPPSHTSKTGRDCCVSNAPTSRGLLGSRQPSTPSKGRSASTPGLHLPASPSLPHAERCPQEADVHSKATRVIPRARGEPAGTWGAGRPQHNVAHLGFGVATGVHSGARLCRGQSSASDTSKPFDPSKRLTLSRLPVSHSRRKLSSHRARGGAGGLVHVMH